MSIQTYKLCIPIYFVHQHLFGYKAKDRELFTQMKGSLSFILTYTPAGYIMYVNGGIQ